MITFRETNNVLAQVAVIKKILNLKQKMIDSLNNVENEINPETYGPNDGEVNHEFEEDLDEIISQHLIEVIKQEYGSDYEQLEDYAIASLEVGQPVIMYIFSIIANITDVSDSDVYDEIVGEHISSATFKYYTYWDEKE